MTLQYVATMTINLAQQRRYGLVYLVYKRVVDQGHGPGNNRVAPGTLLGRVTFPE